MSLKINSSLSKFLADKLKNPNIPEDNSSARNTGNVILETAQALQGDSFVYTDKIDYESSVLSLIYDDNLLVNNISKNNFIEIEGMFQRDVISNLNTNYLSYKTWSEYNFYTDYYEDTAKKNPLIEPALPNLYIFADFINEDKNLYKNLSSYFEEIDLKVQDSIRSSNEYFDQVAKLIKRSQTQPEKAAKLVSAASRQIKLYFTKQGTNRLSQINENKNLAPFFNTVDFFTHRQSTVVDILDASNFTDQFCKFLFGLETNMSNEKVDIITDVYVNGDFSEIQVGDFVPVFRFDSGQQFLSTISTFINSEPLRDVTFLGNTENIQAGRFESAINFNIAADRLLKYFEASIKTPEQFFNGAASMADVLMYEVKKRPLNTKKLTAETQQKIYFPNLSNIENIQFNDSQVKFSETYEYTLSGYYFALQQKINDREIALNFLNVIDSQEYAKLTAKLKEDLEAQKTDLEKSNITKNFIIDIFDRLIKSGVRVFTYQPIIFKREIFKDTSLVYDRPPSWPEIEIDGAIGIDNKILIRLNSSISEIEQQPVLIQPEDQQIFLKNIQLQKLSSLSDKILFDGDDRIDYFQIFRLETHPEKYEEFKDNFVTASTTIVEDTSENSFISNTILKTNHSSYIDTVEPNKKYYYTFRSVDIHGNISNPSPVYEVEIINSDGTIFPIIKIVDLLKKDSKSTFKDVRRFLYITPNTLQALINEKESGYFKEDGTPKDSAELILNDVKLGISENKIWNKKYRLKVRSKRTGKLTEIDFKFTYTPEQNNN